MAAANGNDMWAFKFLGDPDLNDAAQIAALGSIPRVSTDLGDHSLMKATPWAGWTTIPGANADAAPVGAWVSQDWWDLWCFEGAIASP